MTVTILCGGARLLETALRVFPMANLVYVIFGISHTALYAAIWRDLEPQRIKMVPFTRVYVMLLGTFGHALLYHCICHKAGGLDVAMQKLQSPIAALYLSLAGADGVLTGLACGVMLAIGHVLGFICAPYCGALYLLYRQTAAMRRDHHRRRTSAVQRC